MSTAIITTNIANLDKEDRDTADYMIEQENKQRAAMSPPLDPPTQRQRHSEVLVRIYFGQGWAEHTLELRTNSKRQQP